MRISTYERASATLGEGGRRSVNSQFQANRSHIERIGGTFTRDYRDMSAYDEARPAFWQMMNAASRGEFDKLVVACPDRLGRNSPEVIAAIAVLIKLGVEVVFVEEVT